MNLIHLLKLQDYPGKWKDVEDALRSGEDPNQVSCPEEGVSAMHLAAGLGEEAVRLLLQYGGQPNTESADGTTPLHVAASWGCKTGMLSLLRHGANSSQRDENGKTPYDLALEGGYLDCAELLVPQCTQVSSPLILPFTPARSGSDFCNTQGSPCETITQKLYKYLEEGTPVYIDATSPDTPCIGMKQLHIVTAGGDHISPRTPPKLSHNVSFTPHPSPCKSAPELPIASPHRYCHNQPSSFFIPRQSSVSRSVCKTHSNPDYGYCTHQIRLPSQNCCSPNRQVNFNCCSAAPCSRKTDFYSHSHHQHTLHCLCNDSCPHSHKDQTCIEAKLLSAHNSHSCCHSGPSFTENIPIPKQPFRQPCFSPDKEFKLERKVQHVEPQILKVSGEERCILKRKDNSSNKKKLYESRNEPNDLSSTSDKNLDSPRSYFAPINSNEDKAARSPSLHSDVGRSPSKHSSSSKYASSLASSAASPHDRVAAFVLSTADFMSRCKVEDKHDSTSQTSTKVSQTKGKYPQENVSGCSGRETISESSANSFETCSEGDPHDIDLLVKEKRNEAYTPQPAEKSCPTVVKACFVDELVKEKEKELYFSKPAENISESVRKVPCVDELVKEQERKFHLVRHDKENLPAERKVEASHGSVSKRALASWTQWKPPGKPITNNPDDIYTSDESYLTHRSPRIYRMKSRVAKRDECQSSQNRRDAKKHDRDIMSPTSEKKMQKAKPLLNEAYALSDDSLFSNITARQNDACKLSSGDTDSLFSTVTTTEVVIDDKESGIVLIEKHTPSVSGGSVGRRSLDSMTSAATADSQTTFIYDWRTLGKLAKQVGVRTSLKTLPKQPSSQSLDTAQNRSMSPQGSSHASEDVIGPSLPGSEKPLDSEVPDHLQLLSCEEISQELRKYGELPGPVVSSTRQVYLRRLSSLEANTGLVTLTRKCPDFPPELRQALEGKFDASHLPVLELKMVEEFSGSSQGCCKQWREGTVKSSFTYLLLDPRVTENLPLRAKEMPDLEVFKTFVCAIFYIGKGKRARPYSHLHEAVRVKNRNVSNNVSKKVQQVTDIWSAGLGVVSLHCFQSVIPVEAYTREACMIEAIGLYKLTNLKRGDFYGVASSWSMPLRRQVGVYLLQKALQIFLAEGERQICLPDLCT